jgi:hypothetical protein
LIIKTIGATIVTVIENFFESAIFLGSDYLDPYWNGPTAQLAPNGFTEVDLVGDVGIFARNFPDEFAHRSLPDAAYCAACALIFLQGIRRSCHSSDNGPLTISTWESLVAPQMSVLGVSEHRLLHCTCLLLTQSGHRDGSAVFKKKPAKSGGFKLLGYME